MEGKELEALRLDKDEAAAEWIDPSPRLREDTVALKSLAAPAKHVVTKCQALESMNKFYLLGDARGQGFGLVIWGHGGLRYDVLQLHGLHYRLHVLQLCIQLLLITLYHNCRMFMWLRNSRGIINQGLLLM